MNLFTTKSKGYVLGELNIWHCVNTKQARIISLLDNTWKPRLNDVVEKFIFFSPLSTSTFHSLIASNASREIRTILFTQVNEGIAFLHKQGITHRDIKPANLTVQSYDPPLAQIIDFGSATAKKTILYDWPGTIPYLAPEQREGEYHGCHVDYWACALVGLQILGYRLPNKQVNESGFDKIHNWLDVKSIQPIVVCCKAMLQWEPYDRMTAYDALRDPLSQYRERAPPINGHSLKRTKSFNRCCLLLDNGMR
jgi:serine/threonine protein kinase